MRDPVQRWRLLLGRYAERQFGACLGGADAERDRALAFLYDREYAARGLRPASGPRSAGLDPTQLRALDWLSQVRQLFPQATFEALRAEAVERYALTDLLKDPRVVADLDPSPSLLRAVLSFRDRADPAFQNEIRALAQRVIEEIMRRLKAKIERAFAGRRDRHKRSPMKAAANFDARRTVRANLASYDPDRRVLLAERLHFIARQKRRLDWTIILCVDQSGSMTDSLIFSAIMAAVLAGLPGIRVKMVLFDTSVVDVTAQLDDPLAILLSVQLGGGTDIGKAVSYCEGLVESPTRTVFALISDFMEGGSPRRLLSAVARLNEARVKMLGIAALDDTGQADFDRAMAARLAGMGMDVAALTPEAFADWLAGIMQ
jgi:Mg-chelatase subunit ChlD